MNVVYNFCDLCVTSTIITKLAVAFDDLKGEGNALGVVPVLVLNFEQIPSYTGEVGAES